MFGDTLFISPARDIQVNFPLGYNNRYIEFNLTFYPFMTKSAPSLVFFFIKGNTIPKQLLRLKT